MPTSHNTLAQLIASAGNASSNSTDGIQLAKKLAAEAQSLLSQHSALERKAAKEREETAKEVASLKQQLEAAKAQGADGAAAPSAGVLVSGPPMKDEEFALLLASVSQELMRRSRREANQ
jgi:hypothetical protein